MTKINWDTAQNKRHPQPNLITHAVQFFYSSIHHLLCGDLGKHIQNNYIFYKRGQLES